MILVVEDNPKEMRLIEDLLQTMGQKIIKAVDGEEGVELARQHKPALILMDIMMPKMDGYTACQTIKLDTSLKTIPVVMLTSLDYSLNMDLAREVGSDGYMTKPADVDKLKKVLTEFSITS